jgi:hypothetical protein
MWVVRQMGAEQMWMAQILALPAMPVVAILAGWQMEVMCDGER